MAKNLLPEYSRRLERVIKFLRGCDLEELERKTGISKWTALKIRQRQIKQPSVESIDTLYSYTQKQ